MVLASLLNLGTVLCHHPRAGARTCSRSVSQLASVVVVAFDHVLGVRLFSCSMNVCAYQYVCMYAHTLAFVQSLAASYMIQLTWPAAVPYPGLEHKKAVVGQSVVVSEAFAASTEYVMSFRGYGMKLEREAWPSGVRDL